MPLRARSPHGRTRSPRSPRVPGHPRRPPRTALQALADLQRIALTHGIKLPTSFALVGKTLSQADEIARLLDPTLDPSELFEEDGLETMLQEVERRLEPSQLLALASTQLEPLTRLPRRAMQLLSRAETGTLKIGIVPTDLGDLEALFRSAANRLAAGIVIGALLVSSALMARVDHSVSLVGFVISALLGLYLLWKIVSTPGDV